MLLSVQSKFLLGKGGSSEKCLKWGGGVGGRIKNA